jgi:hypothetical protein
VLGEMKHADKWIDMLLIICSFYAHCSENIKKSSLSCAMLITILKVFIYIIITFYFQGTDQTMLAKLHKTHGSHRNYLKPKSDINTSFGLNHFAGVVFYDTRGEFLRGH